MIKIIHYFYLLLISGTLWSCAKTGTIAERGEAALISGTIVPADPYMGDGDKNYCRGCGSSSDPSWACIGTSCTHDYNCGYTRVLSYVTGSTTDYITIQSTYMD